MNNYQYITGGTTNPLISKFTTGGEVNTSEPPKQYAETALERVKNYDVNTDPNSGMYIKDYLGKNTKITPPGETTQDKENRLEAMSFIRRWYANPVTQQILSQNDHHDYEKWGVRSYNGKIITYPEDARNLITVATLSNTPVEYTELPENTLGQHLFTSPDVSKNKIQMNINRPSGQRYTFIHELIHALQKQIPGLATPTQKIQYRLKPGVMPHNYLDKPYEIHSRLFEFRKYHNLSPEKRDYTAEEVEEMQKKTEGMEGYLGGVTDLNRLDPQTLANYLNFVASNDRNTQPNIRTNERSNTAFAKHGGKLLSKHSFNINNKYE